MKIHSYFITFYSTISKINKSFDLLHKLTQIVSPFNLELTETTHSTIIIQKVKFNFYFFNGKLTNYS